MKVDYTEYIVDVTLDDLAVGDAFFYKEKLYIKSASWDFAAGMEIKGMMPHNCIAVGKGGCTSAFLDWNVQVEPVEATLHVIGQKLAMEKREEE